MDEKTLLAGDEYLEQLKRSHRQYRDPAFRPFAPPPFDPASAPVKLIAYYLPQFHPIPENDAWWGKGFTEWANVTRARAQFHGHYQPHLPADLGFYDLRNEEVIEQQAQIAKMHGISGFCIYHYWFNGRRLLEKPLDILYRRKDIDIGFCLCWANENWTRRWDGEEAEVLIAQTHSPESDMRYIDDALHYMNDPRYIRIDDRPVLVIYRAAILPDMRATIERWRKRARERLGTDLFLVCALTFEMSDQNTTPSSFGFDAAVQFPPHGMRRDVLTHTIRPFSSDYGGQVFDYGGVAASAREQLEAYNFPVIPAVFPSWDNTARRGEQGHCFIGSEPRSYASWLSDAVLHAVDKPVYGQSYVFINAWNEWAEGAHLEPDQKYGYAYLQKTTEVLKPYVPLGAIAGGETCLVTAHAMVTPEQAGARSRVATILHAFYPDALEELLSDLPEEAQNDVFITIPEDPPPVIMAIIAERLKSPHLYFYPNQGRDIRPFLGVVRAVHEKGYPYFLKIHTKKSTHRLDGDAWRSSLVQPLLKSLSNGQLERLLDQNADVGLLSPIEHLIDVSTFMGSGGNVAWLRRLCEELQINAAETFYPFPAGSMFAGRVSALLPLASHPYLGKAFETEDNQTDGTLSHALERFLGVFIPAQGLCVAGLKTSGRQVTIEKQLSNNNPSYQFAMERSRTIFTPKALIKA